MTTVPKTHFGTFIDAFTAVDQRSRRLDGDFVLCPPSADFGYYCTPRNGLTFSSMGCDGVHHAILKLDGHVRDDSPVVHVRPMDSDDLKILAESFLSYLALGCGVSGRKMQSVFDAERAGKRQLVAFLSRRFDGSSLLGEKRTDPLTARLGHLIVRKPLQPVAGGWSGATVHHEGFPLALRVRPHVDGSANQRRWPRLAAITHNLAKVRRDGLPQARYNQGLADFDHDVIGAFERDEQGIVAVVETFVGRRNYFAYVADSVRAATIARGLRRQYPQHKLTARDRSDPEWALYADYRARWPW